MRSCPLTLILPIATIVLYANSLDLDETPSKSASHPDPSVWHSDNIFTNFEWLWNTLKFVADRKFSRHFQRRIRVKFSSFYCSLVGWSTHLTLMTCMNGFSSIGWCFSPFPHRFVFNAFANRVNPDHGAPVENAKKSYPMKSFKTIELRGKEINKILMYVHGQWGWFWYNK